MRCLPYRCSYWCSDCHLHFVDTPKSFSRSFDVRRVTSRLRSEAQARTDGSCLNAKSHHSHEWWLPSSTPSRGMPEAQSPTIVRLILVLSQGARGDPEL